MIVDENSKINSKKSKKDIAIVIFIILILFAMLAWESILGSQKGNNLIKETKKEVVCNVYQPIGNYVIPYKNVKSIERSYAHITFKLDGSSDKSSITIYGPSIIICSD
jgi:flagellar basal body-associated protein FliL